MRALVIVLSPRISHWPVIVPVVSSDRNTEPVPLLALGGTVLAPMSWAYRRHDCGSWVGVASGRGVLVEVGVVVVVLVGEAVAVAVAVAMLVLVDVAVAVAVDMGVAVGVGVGLDWAMAVGCGSSCAKSPIVTNPRNNASFVQRFATRNPHFHRNYPCWGGR
jgi:hypothetical protein